MNAREIRQSFIDFFASKKHEVVPSAPLLPESPNLMFTNAGMNQFVPYFLGDQKAPYPRATDTQKMHQVESTMIWKMWIGHLSPHFFRNAGKLVLRRLFQTRGY